jgi:hypothetical protein
VYAQHGNEQRQINSVGRGNAHSVGQAITYWVLKSHGYVIARSTVRPLTSDELRSETEKTARDTFMTELTSHVGAFDPNRIHTDLANAPDAMAEPLFPNPSVDNDEDEPAKLHHLLRRHLDLNPYLTRRCTWLTGTVSRSLRLLDVNVTLIVSFLVASIPTPS